MPLRIKSVPDFVSGLTFIVIGAAVMWLAGDYNPGTAARMGPGYFPRLLGGVLALLGVIIGAQAIVQKTPEGHDAPFPLRNVLMTLIAIAAFWVLLGTLGKRGYTGLDIPVVVMLVLAFFASRELFWVLAGIAAFGLLLQPAGLVVATFALIFISSIASHEFSWKSTLISWVLLLLLSLGVFVYGLKLQFPVWPPFLFG
ncbi:MAG TPA: tripartite tricarboxylate transporter TctB family protein [Burkholderiaceae bacterium]|nr:tripartite tricarboxylate transporter TctB family protein [Burkholderiaceae bacterium]